MKDNNETGLQKYEGDSLANIDSKRSIQQVKENIERIHDILKNQMKEDVHFGVIPGTKNKTLYKAGAELIAMNFGIRPEYEITVENYSPQDYPNLPNAEFHKTYEVICRLYKYLGDADDVLLAEGIGTCSTLETKFRYRNNYNNGRKTKVENPNIADTWNTVKKIAKKRAFVDAITGFTAASNIFVKSDDEPTPESNGNAEGYAEYKEVKDDIKIDKDVTDPLPPPTFSDIVNPDFYIERIKQYEKLEDGLILLGKFISEYTQEIQHFDKDIKDNIRKIYIEVKQKLERK